MTKIHEKCVCAASREFFPSLHIYTTPRECFTNGTNDMYTYVYTYILPYTILYNTILYHSTRRYKIVQKRVSEES